MSLSPIESPMHDSAALVSAPNPASVCTANRPTTMRLARQQILVVDDNRDAADSLAQLFNVMGADTLVAYGAQEALDLMKTVCPKVAFIDISMPCMDGYELAAKMRCCDTCPGVVLIALTGWSHDSDAHNTMNTGFDHHLTKPADLQQLTNLLGTIA